MPVGIDNGLDGGLSHVTDTGILDDYAKMPTKQDGPKRIIDSREVVLWLRKYKGEPVGLEDFRVGGKIKVNTLNSMARSYGALRACVDLVGNPRHSLFPNDWQGHFWKRDDKEKSTKDYAEECARKLWPTHNFHATDRCYTPHDGIIDAALIAEFVRRKALDSLLPPTEKEEFELNFVRTWNALVTGTGIGGIRGTIPKGRLSQWNQRLKQPDWKDNFEDAIKAMVKDDHCLGNNQRGWKANLEYFLRPDTQDKLLGRAAKREEEKKKKVSYDERTNY